MAVEIDGAVHDHPDRTAHGQRRSAWLGAHGLAVMRVSAEDVRVNLEGVLASIRSAAEDRVRG